MSYLVLARKCRPQTFASVLGQEHITTALANAIGRNRVPHALLFTGPRGVGKTSTARILAKALNCQAPEGVEPCGACVSCQEIARSTSMAVIEIDGASNNSVDDVRQLIESLYTAPPPGSRYKIYIIDEVHMLSTAAFNALLKSLEEPPPNTIFIFATTEPHKIPDTVTSRCQRHEFRRLPTAMILSHLEQITANEGVQLNPQVLAFIARRAQGGMRDAQSMLDRLLVFSSDSGAVDLHAAEKIFGALDTSFFIRLSGAVLAGQVQQALELLHRVFEECLDVRAFAADFVLHFRNLLLVSALKDSGSKDSARVVGANVLAQLSFLDLTADETREFEAQTEGRALLDFQRLFALAEQTAREALSTNAPRYVFEAGVVQLATLESLRPIAEIVAELRGAAGPRLSSGGSGSGGGGRETGRSSISEGPRTIEPALQVSEAESELPAFNPSWQNFVQHVRSRSEVVLAAFLTRVAPQLFELGNLELAASAFDLQSLKDPDLLAKLKNCLHSYSGEQAWNVRFSEVKNAAAVGLGHAPLKGSLAEDAALSRRVKIERIEKEARSSSAVMDALSTFEGAAVERVAPAVKS